MPMNGSFLQPIRWHVKPTEVYTIVFILPLQRQLMDSWSRLTENSIPRLLLERTVAMCYG